MCYILSVISILQNSVRKAVKLKIFRKVFATFEELRTEVK